MYSSKILILMSKIWEIEKLVLPQHSDHAGVMWHGTYFDWLEEGRINALSKAGINLSLIHI